ncbi:hypothetical protein [Rhizobacter sp. Root1221]|uniref:hypothetical protein n=1 Tax=Rhizobacter sp. Root1221 TaxID=1736433 RepID=UPI0007004761|nr:hypothetical protein [Rhizobacter sp. Root1221]KQV92870.1 hypothetical protein ASC87_27330 [Rhizobacter sp. Root1221]
MSADRRGYVYPLEPLRLQAQWQLDALQRDLADCAARLAASGKDRLAAQAQLDAAARAARPTSATGFDPALAHRRLAYLADAQKRIAALVKTETETRTEHGEWQAKCHAAQLKVDAIERDSEERLQEHVAERARQQAVVADQDWLARAAWHRHTMGPEEVR